MPHWKPQLAKLGIRKLCSGRVWLKTKNQILSELFFSVKISSVQKDNNFAFIDGANLHKGVITAGWKLDYKRFRKWLSDKYSVERAYLFIGLVPKYNDLYTSLQESGFTLVFKETVTNQDGFVKGNCDADLVLWSVRGVYEELYNKAVIVSSDGDYASLVKFLQEKERLLTVISPSSKCSILLRKSGAPLSYLRDVRSLFEIGRKEKTPDRDKTL